MNPWCTLKCEFHHFFLWFHQKRSSLVMILGRFIKLHGYIIFGCLLLSLSLSFITHTESRSPSCTTPEPSTNTFYTGNSMTCDNRHLPDTSTWHTCSVVLHRWYRAFRSGEWFHVVSVTHTKLHWKTHVLAGSRALVALVSGFKKIPLYEWQFRRTRS
jgi:hypothetical protein